VLGVGRTVAVALSVYGRAGEGCPYPLVPPRRAFVEAVLTKRHCSEKQNSRLRLCVAAAGRQYRAFDRMENWTFERVSDQTGRTVIVTGANTGIGLETARMLARRGADVVLACRDRAKGEAAVARIAAEGPSGRARFAALDLADLDSVAGFADDFAAKHERLDLLINNAGVMAPPFARTKQGFELQLGTNHLGHFALTGRLLPLVARTAGARIVVVSSTAQNYGRIDFADLNWERRRYSKWLAYCQSKLANMMFALELARRLAASGSEVRATSAHPGWTATEIQRAVPGSGLANRFAMKPAVGALSTLRAAVDPAAKSATYWGPTGFFELRGLPGAARISAAAQDVAAARRLWDVSEQLTGVSFAYAEPQRRAG
jgi:NAD(P)-dependent dehydrogenase (short-subunit alcohol dehydrogenase family)